MNMKVMAGDINKSQNEHTKNLASALKKAVGGPAGGPAGSNVLQSLYKEKEAKAKTRKSSQSEEEDKKILNFGAFGGGQSMSFGVLECRSDKSIFQMDTSKAMSMLGKVDLRI